MSNPGPVFQASPNRILGALFGAVYLLVGLLGFFYTQGVPFAQPSPGSNNLLIGLFAVNPLHNAVHLVVGAALLLAGVSTAYAAKGTNTTIGVIYLLLGIVGFFLTAPDGGRSPINFLALNTADQFLHLGSAIILLAVGLTADKHVHATAATV